MDTCGTCDGSWLPTPTFSARVPATAALAGWAGALAETGDGMLTAATGGSGCASG